MLRPELHAATINLPSLLLRLALLVYLPWPAPVVALEPVCVAPDVYAFVGDNTEATPENEGFVANAGFIVGSAGVVVIDTGASYRYGQAMIEAIRRVTSKPIQLVIITHAIQDFVFGAAAFSERGIPLLAHRMTVDLMKTRCGHCLGNLRKILDEKTLAGTRLVIPERAIEGSTTMQVGGRTLDITWLGWASTPGDLVIFDRTARVMFVGGIVTAARVPELRDGDYNGWLHAIDTLRSMDAKHVVPGYGPPISPKDMERTAHYLKDLDARMRQLYERGAGLMEGVDNADMDDYAQWSLYPEQHRRNALWRYLQLEVEDLEK